MLKLDQSLLKSIGMLLERYVRDSELGECRVVHTQSIQQISDALGLNGLDLSSPHSDQDILSFLERYLGFTTRLHHPGFIAHQVAVPNQGSALADLVNGMTNNGMAVYEMGPGGVVIENFVVDWLLEKTPWSNGGGVLVHGGSIANLTALLTARSVKDPHAWSKGNNPNGVFITPDTSHYSVHRAISIMGYGEQSIWKAKTDSRGKVLPSSVKELYEKALAENKTIIAVTCNACATATGLYDPIQEIGAFCKEKGLWLHIDGAHGASALLSEQHKHFLSGMKYADSMIWDMHKMLQTSALCAAVLLRRKDHLAKAFEQKASYLEHDQQGARDDMYLKTIECTKAPIGLRFLLNLIIHGEEHFSSFIDLSYDKAKQFYEFLNDQEGLSCPFPPESNILLFRVEGDDELQAEIYNELLNRGKFYITKVKVEDSLFLRLTVMNPLTDLDTIQQLVNEIKTLSSGEA